MATHAPSCVERHDCTCTLFNLVVDGHPEAKERPRFRVIRAGAKVFVNVYTPKKTQQAEKRVLTAWKDAGSPYVEGALTVDMTFYVARPKGHFTSKGTLSAEGRRARWPIKKPDVDNAIKLVLDALNGHAYHDDVDVVSITARRVWAPDGHEMTKVRVAQWGT
jgi:Holliday junction resolvase RusA-like endonuclease